MARHRAGWPNTTSPHLTVITPFNFFSLSLYTRRRAHLPRGERVLGHVDRGVVDGVVSYMVLSQDETHLGVNLPRLQVAMQEVPADAPSRVLRTIRRVQLGTIHGD